MIGASGQPLLQVVPVVNTYNFEFGALHLYGRGFVEDGSTYQLAGASVVDLPATTFSVDVSPSDDLLHIENGEVGFSQPAHGFGNVTVTTAGGTSAPLTLEQLQATASSLHDLAFDPATGQLWAAESRRLDRIDMSTGQVQSSIALTVANTVSGDFSGGLQVLASAMSLAGVAVPAGTLLLFNGDALPDAVIAIDPTTGAALAKLTLGQNYNLGGGVYDPASGDLFIVDRRASPTRIVEINPTTGAEVASFTAPFDASTSTDNTEPSGEAALTIDPATGHLWYGSDRSTNVAELTHTGAVVRIVSLGLQQGLDSSSQVSGLAFDAAGNLLVATSRGSVHRISLDFDPAQKQPTLNALTAVAPQGVSANASQASANAGQVIELTGTNFGPGTQVQFNVRHDDGSTGVVAEEPLIVSADGTRLQVQVPDQATTGDIRVVNSGFGRNLGFAASLADAIYRDVTLNFTASGASSVIDFADEGLFFGINGVSWGIDNVRIVQGSNTIFADSFEGGAKPQWNISTTDNSAPGVFSQFSGRFNSATQTLNLSGLTAGLSYTLKFDLYVLDSWQGLANSDFFDVTVDGQTLFHEALSNRQSESAVQTYNGSGSQLLQIVPTLAQVANGQPGTDIAFDLIGSGFMEGASTIKVGGISFTDKYATDQQFDVQTQGRLNGDYHIVAPLTLDGPIRVTTAGGYAEIAGPAFASQPAAQFTGIQAVTPVGVAADPGVPSANAGQAIVLQGAGFTSQTLVQFTAADDGGTEGTVTRTGFASSDGLTLTVNVPALARSGAVHVLGAANSIFLQVVPTLRGVGGNVFAGNTIELEGSGLASSELLIRIDGQRVSNFAVRTVSDTGSTLGSQQLVSLTVPAGTTAGVITVSTSGGTSQLRTGVTTSGPGETALIRIDAVAASGVPAKSGVASSNVLQTITLLGSGLQSNEQVVFTAIDDNGVLYEDVVSAATVAADGSSLTVVVPNDATTGTVRLQRDSAGIVLQIVPTFDQIFFNNGLYAGNFLELTGSGFAEGASTVLFGDSSLADSSRSTGIVVFSLNFANDNVFVNVPAGVPTGPIRVSTIGGTSDPLNVTFSGLDASAATGTPTDAAKASANAGQTITIHGTGFNDQTGVLFTVVDFSRNLSPSLVRPVAIDPTGTSMQVVVPQDATTGPVRVLGDLNDAEVFLQIVPVVNVVVTSGGPGGAFVSLGGSGFVEGNGSQYTFGTEVITDINPDKGPSADPNGAVLTVPIVPEAFGPISVKTIGGVSAPASLGTVTSIESVAASGTPADPSQASANPGQTITLHGTGLTRLSDVLFTYVNSSGIKFVLAINPTDAAADGTSATIVVPGSANGAFVVGILGATGHPLLQIVPTLTSYLVSFTDLELVGSGFVEDATTYTVAGAVVVDSGGSTSPDVFFSFQTQFDNTGVEFTEPVHGPGVVTVTTAGGTSAPLTLNEIRPGIGSLDGVAFDVSSGQLWVTANGSIATIARVDITTGQVQQTIPVTTAGFGTTSIFGDIQVLPAAMTLANTSVPAGSLLVFNSVANPDRSHSGQSHDRGGDSDPDVFARVQPQRRNLRSQQRSFAGPRPKH